MYRHWHPGVALAAIAIIACSDTTSPDAASRPNGPNLGQYPLDSELAHVKDQGFIVPTLHVTIDDHEARAEATLAYFANFVKLSLTLDVLRGYETIVSRSTVPQEVSGFFPTPGWLQDGIVIPVYQACGLAAQAQASGRSEIRALQSGGSGLITLWSAQAGRDGRAEQPQCPPPPPPGGGGENPYDDQCQLCLEWTWYLGNEEVDSAWVCSAPTPCLAT